MGLYDAHKVITLATLKLSNIIFGSLSLCGFQLLCIWVCIKAMVQLTGRDFMMTLNSLYPA